MEHAHSDENRELGRKRLGRGLHALLGDDGPDDPQPAAPPVPVSTAIGFAMIPVEQLERNPYQPRTYFDPEAIAALAESIKQHGVLQPLLVRQTANGMQLIAGERRLLASRQAGLAEVPCRVVQNFDDRNACEAALEENLKRVDLHDLEKAKSFQRYLTAFGVTIEELARRLSVHRSTISNILRLLDLAEATQQALLEGLISTGHARALIMLPPEVQQQLVIEIAEKGWSVRQAEQAVRDRQEPNGDGGESSTWNAPGEPEETPDTVEMKRDAEPSNHIVSLQNQLRDLTGAKVTIRQTGKDSGQVILHFNSNDEFERIMRVFRRDAA